MSTMNKLQKTAGISAIAEALIYIAAFVYFGVFSSMPSSGNPAQLMTYLAENRTVVSLVYFVIYVVFGVLLAVLVTGLHERLKHTQNPALNLATLFGAIWVGLVIASGMIATIGLSHAVDLMQSSYEKAFDVWTIVSVITESIGGGNELVGGIWLLLVSIVALQSGVFPKGLHYLGVFVGISGVATVYPADVFTEIFGITQIVWFTWLGVCLLTQKEANTPMQPTA